MDVNHIKRFLNNKRIHCFRLYSPLEAMSKSPYTIFSKDESSTSNARVHGNLKKVINEEFGKRMKFLNIKERYLEEFISEML